MQINLFFRQVFGSRMLRESGFIEVGELNNIVMVFPQISKKFHNHFGCWDFFGYTGSNYGEFSFKKPQTR